MRKAGMAKQFIVELDGVVPALIVIGTAIWDIECYPSCLVATAIHLTLPCVIAVKLDRNLNLM